MNITALLQRAGNALKHQRLDGSFVSMRQKKKNAEVTFSTEGELAAQLAKSVMTGKAADYVGLVVWVPATAWESSPDKASKPPATEIEICDRMMDRWHDNFGQERVKFHAQITGEDGYWSCGRDIEDAVDSLIRSHAERFPNGRDGVRIVYLGKLAR